MRDHTASRLAGKGYFTFTSDELEKLSIMEHDRWADEKVAAGSTLGDEDPKLKKDPDLVPWRDLPRDIAEWDTNFVRAIPAMLAAVGLQIIERQRVGTAIPRWPDSLGRHGHAQLARKSRCCIIAPVSDWVISGAMTSIGSYTSANSGAEGEARALYQLCQSGPAVDRSAPDGLAARAPTCVVGRRTGRRRGLVARHPGADSSLSGVHHRGFEQFAGIETVPGRVLGYAEAFWRPVLPIQVGPIDSLRVTPLAARQILDFRNPTKQSTLRLITSVQQRQAQVPTQPWPPPDEPPVPFAYLMRLASTLASPELSRHQQSDLMTELKDRLDDDRHDPTAYRDITQLLRLLRDRSDVTWRIRTEIDATLGSIESPAFSAAATVPLTGPQPASTDPFSGRPPAVTSPFSGPQPAVTGPFSGPQPTASPPPPPGHIAKSGRIRRRSIGVGALGVAVSIRRPGIGLKVALPHGTSDRLGGMLVCSDSDINAIMGANDMQTVEYGQEAAKGRATGFRWRHRFAWRRSIPGWTPPTRAAGSRGSPGRSRTRRRVGRNRAGEDNDPFVDQDIAEFKPNSDQAFAFVTKTADQWKGGANQAATASLPHF